MRVGGAEAFAGPLLPLGLASSTSAGPAVLDGDPAVPGACGAEPGSLLRLLFLSSCSPGWEIEACRAGVSGVCAGVSGPGREAEIEDWASVVPGSSCASLSHCCSQSESRELSRCLRVSRSCCCWSALSRGRVAAGGRLAAWVTGRSGEGNLDVVPGGGKDWRPLAGPAWRGPLKLAFSLFA